MKFYAVRSGYKTGIFDSWQECQEQTKGYPGAVFKSFETLEAAQQYVSDTDPVQPINEQLPFAYIDGTYSKTQNCYGYGGFLFTGSKYHIIQGTGSNPAYLAERNIAGELLGTLQVVHSCLKAGINEVNIYFDYQGIEAYQNGSWQARTELAQYYKDTLDLLQSDVQIHFVKVKGHTGVAGNEIADYLAKEAIGAKLRKKDIAALAEFRAAAGGATA